jgi:hypothetical protein
VLRLPAGPAHNLALDQLRIQTAEGSVPISNFATRVATPTTGTLTRLRWCADRDRSGRYPRGRAVTDHLCDQITKMLDDVMPQDGLTSRHPLEAGGRG